MRKSVLSALVAAGLAVAFAAPLPAAANDTGLAHSLHKLKRERGKLCQVGHYHFGDASGKGSKSAALVEAKRRWSNFTALEYGSAWARWSRAADRGWKCSKKRRGWSCSVSARPCK